MSSIWSCEYGIKDWYTHTQYYSRWSRSAHCSEWWQRKGNATWKTQMEIAERPANICSFTNVVMRCNGHIDSFCPGPTSGRFVYHTDDHDSRKINVIDLFWPYHFRTWWLPTHYPLLLCYLFSFQVQVIIWSFWWSSSFFVLLKLVSKLQLQVLFLLVLRQFEGLESVGTHTSERSGVWS